MTRQRGGAGHPVRARRRRARRGRGRLEPAVVLHAGHQPVRQAAPRPHSRQRLELRVPRGRRSHAAGRLRDLPGHRSRRARRRRRQRAALPAVLRSDQPRRPRRRRRLLHHAAAAAHRPARPEARAGSRSGYVGSEVFLALVDAKQAPYSADLRQLSVRALCTNRDLRAADAGRPRADRFLAEHRRAGDQRACGHHAQPSVFAGRRGAVRVARDQPPVAQLPVARRRDGPAGRRGACAICSSSTRRPPTSARGGRSRAIRGVSVSRVVRRLPGRGPIAFGRGRASHRGSGRNGVRRRQRLSARRGARPLLRAVRVDQRRHGNRAATRQVEAKSIRWTPNWGTRPML